MKYDLKCIPSYSGIHFILSQAMEKKVDTKTSLEMFQEQIDVNQMWTEDFDISNSILADEPMELAQEQEFYEERFLEEYEDTLEHFAQLEQDEG